MSYLHISSYLEKSASGLFLLKGKTIAPLIDRHLFLLISGENLLETSNVSYFSVRFLMRKNKCSAATFLPMPKAFFLLLIVPCFLHFAVGSSGVLKTDINDGFTNLKAPLYLCNPFNTSGITDDTQVLACFGVPYI